MVIQIVEEPRLFPQRCFFTGDGLPRPIIDTGVNDLEGGRVYMSLSFADDLADAAGYMRREEAAALREENARLRAQVDAVPNILEGLSNDVRNLASAAVLDLLQRAADSAVSVPEVGIEAPEGDQ